MWLDCVVGFKHLTGVVEQGTCARVAQEPGRALASFKFDRVGTAETRARPDVSHPSGRAIGTNEYTG